MSEPVDPATIEEIVGVRRHGIRHLGRAVSEQATVYVLHSHVCRDEGRDLRNCDYSRALDAGIDLVRWAGMEDTPVLLRIEDGKLVPEALPSGPVCPECRAGKHGNCDSQAWDEWTDMPTSCLCWTRGHHQEQQT